MHTDKTCAWERPGQSRVGLELQNKAQAFIDGALQARRQRAGVLGQETTIEGRELRLSLIHIFRG